MEVDTEGELVDGGASQQRRTIPMDISGDSMDTGRDTRTTPPKAAASAARDRQRRRLPQEPSSREAQEWHASWQAKKGKHASCYGCATRFEDSELRIARPSDVRGNASRYLHAHCLPGGFHRRVPSATLDGQMAHNKRLHYREHTTSTTFVLNKAAQEPVLTSGKPLL